ncbi:hypothetical protein J4437_02165 [Candidatus Woesearchaeota archaeon]|nr:hypothetical protein [Candidatus Woesearchaeota archaeon]
MSQAIFLGARLDKEMMHEAVKAKIQSEETFEEYRAGLVHLNSFKKSN